MTSTSSTGNTRSRSESETSSTSDPAKKQSRLESDTSCTRYGGCEPGTLADDAHALAVPNAYPRQEPRNERTFEPGDHLHQMPSCSFPVNENEETVITAIRATDVALGLRRLPTGFFTLLHHNGLEWRTENKLSSVDHGFVEWSGPIPISSDISATICLEVYASFEFQPMLGSGERLRKLTVTVEQLLERSENGTSFVFFPKDGEVVSPCSSIFVTAKQQRHENDGPSVTRVFGPRWSTPESPGELEDATNQGHSALSRYRKCKEKQDLERCTRQYERALNICPLDHPCRTAAQSNLAMAKLILCQVEDTDAPLEVPLRLYRDALNARPVGHPDRPSTLIHLAAVHLARFKKRRNHNEGRHAEALLHEAMELGSADSHDNRAATFMCRLYAGCGGIRVQPIGQTSVEQDATSRLTDEDLRIVSIRLLKRFERFGDLADLQHAIAILQDLVGCTSSWDDRHHTALGNLGTALWYRFNRLGELIDLEDAISRTRDATDLTPHGHPDKPSHLTNLGSSFLTRFQRLGQLNDLEDAISRLQEAVDLTPCGHIDKPRNLNNLGNSFLIRFERLGQLSDLEDAIETYKAAVDLAPHGHPDRPALLSNLGYTFRTRFELIGQLSDLEDAISRQKDAIDLIPHDHPDKPSQLNNLGNSFLTRFQRLGQLSDLERAIETYKGAVEFTPHGHPDEPRYLNNLGHSFFTRFQHLGQLGDLEDAIVRQRDAVGLIPHGHPDRPNHLNSIGNSLLIRFERLGRLSDLEDAISKQRDAVKLTPHGHPRKPGYLNNLGSSFLTRFHHLGQLSDLEDAISRQTDAVDLTPHGHADKPTLLNGLGHSFKTRFERLGQLGDLKDAISRQKDAVHLIPHGHPRKPRYLANLANSFLTRFQHLGQLSDLEDAISSLKDAVDLTPHGHPDRPHTLNSLGNSFSNRFQRLGQLSDLERAIEMYKDAVDRLGQLSDLEDAISAYKDAVDLIPCHHPEKPGFLNNLGNSFLARFERLGQLSDLEDAVSMYRDAVDLIPHGHLAKPHYLNNLGNSFLTRFDRLSQFNDLEDAISAYRDAVDIIPHAHPKKPGFLSNLGSCLITRFERHGQLSDIEDAISRQKDAVKLIPHGHPHKPTLLDNLGSSFLTRFGCLGHFSDLEDAISMYRDAIDLTPDGHADKPNHLNNLSKPLLTRFRCLGQLIDLEDAISRQKEAVDLIPYGHPRKGIILTNLGISLTSRFDLLGEQSNLEHAISVFSHAASSPIGSIDNRFHASQKWISCARRICHPSLLHAYSVALSLVPQLAWIGLPLTHRYNELTRDTRIVREAAAAALDAGFPETAVEWLEQGRSIVWGELFQLRGSYEKLSATHPDHARRLRELSAQLEHASVTHEKSLSTLSEQTQGVAHHTAVSPRQLADRHRTLAIERDKLLKEIRRLRGFEQFLLRKEFSQLRASAHSGPVVILNAAETRCDALIVLAEVDHVIHVPLPNFTFKRCADLQTILKDFVRHAREGKRAPRNGIDWEHILSPLWQSVVKPVLDSLAILAPGDLSRIFWCPTGPLAFLPIHAAGLYDRQYSEPGHKIFDFLVSSYVPTLSILSQPDYPDSAPSSGNLHLLLVRQPPSDGVGQLPGVAVELERIKDVVRNSSSGCTTLLETSVGTVEEVLDLMKQADWVHFACHGIQDGVESGLCLADKRRLTLREIVALSRPRGGFAFLSACQTATGEKHLSDEAIHVAAGMLFAGYGGVVGTMWSISDRLAPDVARDVYARLFGKGARPDYLEAARALHDATEGLRDRGVSFDEWIPFIHIGL